MYRCVTVPVPPFLSTFHHGSYRDRVLRPCECLHMSFGYSALELFLQLGVSVDADDVALKRGYRKAAMKVRHSVGLATMTTTYAPPVPPR